MQIKIHAMTKPLREYIRKYSLQSLVLGISGGIDSALVAAMVKDAQLDIPLIGLSLPSNTNKSEEIQRAHLIGREFCDEFHEIEIDQFIDTLKIISDNDPVRLGNIKARIRMIILYDCAKKNKGVVLSTDNYTEYMLGFSTIMGDWGDFCMIQYLWKTEVYEIAEYLIGKTNSKSLQMCYDAVPTDGLGISSSDLEQIEAETYADVDNLLKAYLNGDRSNYNHPVIQRHVNSEFKRNWPITIKRDAIFR
jgi:NAD+ synthetase